MGKDLVISREMIEFAEANDYDVMRDTDEVTFIIRKDREVEFLLTKDILRCRDWGHGYMHETKPFGYTFLRFVEYLQENVGGSLSTLEIFDGIENG